MITASDATAMFPDSQLLTIPHRPANWTHKPGWVVQTKRQIEACEACDRVCGGTGPTPPAMPTAKPADFAIMHGAAQLTKPETQLTKELLSEVGLDITTAAIIPTVMCDTGTKPTWIETKTCHSHLLDVLDLVPGPYVLVVGAEALNMIRPELTVKAMAGRWLTWGRFWALVCPHPGSIMGKRGLRGGGRASSELAEMRRCVDQFGAVVQNQTAPEIWNGRCEHPKCVGRTKWIDSVGFEWCGRHETVGKRKQSQEQWRWEDDVTETGQGKML